jgi:hypothetical protein
VDRSLSDETTKARNPDRLTDGCETYVVLTASVFIGTRGAGIAIATASGGSSSSGAAW